MLLWDGRMNEEEAELQGGANKERGWIRLHENMTCVFAHVCDWAWHDPLGIEGVVYRASAWRDSGSRPKRSWGVFAHRSGVSGDFTLWFRYLVLVWCVVTTYMHNGISHGSHGRHCPFGACIDFYSHCLSVCAHAPSGKLDEWTKFLGAMFMNGRHGVPSCIRRQEGAVSCWTLSLVPTCGLSRKSVSLYACLYPYCECFIATLDLSAAAVRLTLNWRGMDDLPDFDGEGEESTPKPGGVLTLQEDEVMQEVQDVKSEGTPEVKDEQADVLPCGAQEAPSGLEREGKEESKPKEQQDTPALVDHNHESGQASKIDPELFRQQVANGRTHLGMSLDGVLTDIDTAKQVLDAAAPCVGMVHGDVARVKLALRASMSKCIDSAWCRLWQVTSLKKSRQTAAVKDLVSVFQDHRTCSLWHFRECCFAVLHAMLKAWEDLSHVWPAVRALISKASSGPVWGALLLAANLPSSDE
eukprot:3590978-Amphidinium_carterae.1